MAGKPKAPKVKPINQARIKEVEASVNQQTQRVSEGLATYRTQALSNIDQQLMLQKNAVSGAIADQQKMRQTTAVARQQTVQLLQNRNNQNANVNRAATAVAGVQKQQANRQVATTNNRQANIMQRRLGGAL